MPFACALNCTKLDFCFLSLFGSLPLLELVELGRYNPENPKRVLQAAFSCLMLNLLAIACLSLFSDDPSSSACSALTKLGLPGRPPFLRSC